MVKKTEKSTYWGYPQTKSWKIITGSAGGMFLTDSKEDADKVRKWSTQSMDNSYFVFYKENIRNREGISATFEKEHPDVEVNKYSRRPVKSYNKPFQVS